MKPLLFLAFLFTWVNSYSQDRITIIDSLVNIANMMKTEINVDSSTQKLPDSETILTTYFTRVFDNGLLKKYELKASSFDNTNGIHTPFIQSTTFYYDDNKLIKAETFRLQYEAKTNFEWYYFDDKLIKCTAKDSSKSESLLATAKQFLKGAKK